MQQNKTSIIAELILSPRPHNDTSISKPLKEALSLLNEFNDLKIETHAMGTNLSCNNIDILFDAVKLVHNYLIKSYPRVVTHLIIDERRDKLDRTMQDKVQAVS